MKFKYYLSSIAEVDIYPLIGLLLFVPMFIIIGIWVFKADKNYFNKVSELPLHDGTEK